MQAKLHLVKGNPKGKEVEVPEGTLTIGRAEDRDLIIASTRVSRQHCRITNDETGLTIRDNDSGNGTLVNGTKVTEQQLQPGDQVTVGPLTFVVEIEGVKEKAASEAAPEAASPAPGPSGQKAKPKSKPKTEGPRRAASEDDILASLEQMSGKKGGGSGQPSSESGKKSGSGDDDDVLEISDEDLLDG